MTVSYNIRLDEELKNQAFEVFKSYGITPAQAIKMFLKRTAETKTIPLNFDYQPNATTLEAIRELKEGQSKTYDNLDAMMADIHAEI
ncbi:type II toxin-antitoxin system RelB/DinJ family antitoxin [Thiofilum flexile]|uniref:type II toxin-antitoxin system RelB/DinJ family antitoxin n=1 Tax=Thiofilum flexile TaxID=125627 RepID=UPI00035FD40F|nr:type II toxin-antitoxin system RelB/DinJ family antitoxin [Thiofilum flexile]